jgi:hypothetical protein
MAKRNVPSILTNEGKKIQQCENFILLFVVVRYKMNIFLLEYLSDT